jgi:hypothetical protein
VDRHLLPEEIDLLLDGEAGFGVAPLRAHVRRCAECQAELDTARLVADELDRLPHLVPAPLFADRVMREVQVFEPWHVALGDAVRRLVPQSRPARVLAAAGGLSLATLLTVATLWVVTRVDVLALLGGLAVERTRAAVLAVLGEVARGVLGEGALAAGTGPLVLAAGAFVLTLVAATAGLRRVAAASSRRRE